jgi:PKD repeat protein
VSVCYVPRGPFSCAEAATFTGQIGISPGTFSAGGDSGSLIVTNNTTRSPVGLLFAGSSSRTLANPIGAVLSYFGVSIDTGGGTEPPPTGNTAPAAAFAYSCKGLSCSFTDQSTDDAGVTGWSWTFGDGGTSSARNPSHTFPGAGSWAVTLTVNDAQGLSDSASRTVSCATRGKQVRCN